LALRVLEHEEPRPKTLEDVNDEVTDTLKREGAQTKLDESAKEAVALMLKGTPVSTVAKDDPNATAGPNEVLTRQSTVLDAEVVREIYALAKPAPGKVLVKWESLQNGDRVAYALKAVETPEAETEAEGEGGEDAGSDAVRLDNARLGQAELAAVIANLREQADVSLDP